MIHFIRRRWKPVLGAFCALAVLWFGAPWLVALPERLLTPPTVSTRYLARDGTPLRMLLTTEGERVAAAVTFAEMPAPLIHATLAAEDKRFFHHGGVDLLAIARAAWDNARSGRIVSGASTIHQQLIKVTARREGKRTLRVKVIEALQARRLVMGWERERVLGEYLNRISYGNLLMGCTSAASGYFNKPLRDLTVAECALLAAIPQSPRRYNPFRDLEAIRPRQQRILTKMHELGWISDEALRVALAETLTLQRYTGGFAAPHAVEMLRMEGASSSTIMTTLDAALQRHVETIISGRLSALKDRHVTQAAAVVIENVSGKILALAGSRDFYSKDGGQINGAWAPHSPGSAIKPFTYQLAFERGATPAGIVADLPIEYSTPTGTYRPENYAHRLYGPVTYRDALGNSLNISAVKVLASIGGAETLLTRLRELGLTTLTEDAEHYGLGLTIGNAPVRLIEIANAYACLARLGEWKPWRLVNVPSAAAESPRLLLRSPECYLIADILSDNQARLLTFGTHSPLRLPFRAAVKTGTSQSYRDNWTLGYTPEFTVAVWAGNFDNTPMQEVSGVTGAAPIWRDIMLHLNERQRLTWYAVPPQVVSARIDPRTGRHLAPQSPPARLSQEEWFIKDVLPPQAVAADYDARGRALLPREYAAWVRSGDNWMGDVVVCADDEARREWRITHPIPGTVVRLDPDIRDNGRRLLLETSAGQEITWRCDTLKVEREGAVSFVLLTPGKHDLTARDATTGEAHRTYVIVREE